MLVKDGWKTFEVGSAQIVQFIPPAQQRKGVNLKNCLEKQKGLAYLDKKEVILHLRNQNGFVSSAPALLPATAFPGAIINWVEEDVIEITPLRTSSSTASVVGKKRGPGRPPTIKNQNKCNISIISDGNNDAKKAKQD